MASSENTDQEEAAKGKPRRKVPRERLMWVRRQIANLVAHEDIQVRGAKKFGVGTRQVKRYITMVYQRWLDDDSQHSTFHKAKLRRALEVLFRRCVKGEDFKTALGCLDKIARLDGLLAAEHVVLNAGLGDARPGGPGDPDAVRKRIAELLAARQASTN